MGLGANMKKAMEWAKKYDATLLASDKRFSNLVVVLDEEGSFMCYNSAFVESLQIQDDHFATVFTEHQGFHVFHEGSTTVKQYRRIPVEQYLYVNENEERIALKNCPCTGSCLDMLCTCKCHLPL